jgi:hypothetical protein
VVAGGAVAWVVEAALWDGCAVEAAFGAELVLRMRGAMAVLFSLLAVGSVETSIRLVDTDGPAT